MPRAYLVENLRDRDLLRTLGDQSIMDLAAEAAAEIERKQQQYERSQRYWVDAARKALTGDTEHLRLRVDMALSGPIEMTETET